MLNVSTGFFQQPGLSVTPFIKDIVINDTAAQENEIKSVSLEVSVAIATRDPGPLYGLNLHISAIKDLAYANSVRLGDPESKLRTLILSQFETEKRQYTNVALQDHASTSTTSVVNPSESEGAIYYRTVKVPMTVTYVGDVGYLCLVAVISEGFNSTRTATKSFKEYFQERKFAVSAPSIENVFNSGRPSIRTNLFLLRESLPGYGQAGDVWPSAVHEHPLKGLMAGSSHSDKPHPALNLLRVPNLKVKDYRMGDLNDVTVRYDDPQPGLDTGLSHYISPVSFSRSRDNSLKIFFSFDFASYVINNSSLSYAFANKMSLVSANAIEEIKIYRQRVDQGDYGNRLTPAKHANNAPCFDRATKELVARLSDNSVSFVQASDPGEPNPPGSLLNIYEIMAIDADIASEGPAAYQYSVEIQVVDNSKQIVSEVITDLRNKMSEFETYLLQFYNYEKKGYDVDTYLDASQRFDATSPVWKSVIVEYVSALAFFKGARLSEHDTVLPLTRNLLAMVSPTSATHSSLSHFRNQVNDFILQLENLIGQSKTITTRPYSDSTQSFQSAIDATPSLVRRLKVDFMAQSLYINDLEPNTGFDYLGDGVQMNQTTFDRISVENYGTRISKEINKYDVGNNNLATVNKYGFLTPDVIRLPDGDVLVQKEMDATEALDLLRAKKDESTKILSFVGSPSQEDVKQVDTENLLGLAGVSYKSSAGCIERLSGIISKVGDKAPAVIDSSFYFSATSAFVIDDGSARLPLIEDTSIASNRKRKSVNIAPVQALISAIATNFKEAKAENTRGLVGSYAAAAATSSPEHFSSLNAFEKSIQFNSVAAVEYLSGYDRNTREQIWSALDGATINRIQTLKRPLLCRLTMPENNLNIENAYALSMYTSLFVLGPTILFSKEPALDLTTQREDMKDSINMMISSGVLNNNAAGGPTPSQYTCSNMMVHGDQTGPQSGNAGATTTSGGGY